MASMKAKRSLPKYYENLAANAAKNYPKPNILKLGKHNIKKTYGG